jgi:hypothetical protein
MPMQHLANADSAPVIALHCSGAGAGQWRPLGETLGPAYTLFAPEHHGRERTGPWTGTHAFVLADEAARTIDLIDRSMSKVHHRRSWPHGPIHARVRGQRIDRRPYRWGGSRDPRAARRSITLSCERRVQWLAVVRRGRAVIYPLHRYPTQLIDVLQLPGGTRVVVRPALPQDEDMQRAFVRDLSYEARYYRFMTKLSDLPEAMAERFTTIDYIGHVALVAEVFTDASTAMIGERRDILSMQRCHRVRTCGCRGRRLARYWAGPHPPHAAGRSCRVFRHPPHARRHHCNQHSNDLARQAHRLCCGAEARGRPAQTLTCSGRLPFSRPAGCPCWPDPRRRGSATR